MHISGISDSYKWCYSSTKFTLIPSNLLPSSTSSKQTQALLLFLPPRTSSPAGSWLEGDQDAYHALVKDGQGRKTCLKATQNILFIIAYSSFYTDPFGSRRCLCLSFGCLFLPRQTPLSIFIYCDGFRISSIALVKEIELVLVHLLPWPIVSQTSFTLS